MSKDAIGEDQIWVVFYFLIQKKFTFYQETNLTKLFWSTLIPDTFCEWKDINNFWVFSLGKSEVMNSQLVLNDWGIPILRHRFWSNPFFQARISRKTRKCLKKLERWTNSRIFTRVTLLGYRFPITSPLPSPAFLKVKIPNFPFGGGLCMLVPWRVHLHASQNPMGLKRFLVFSKWQSFAVEERSESHPSSPRD